jgi:hypothetical protein
VVQPTTLIRRLFVLGIVLAAPVALAPTSEELADAEAGMSAGSREVFLASMVDRDAATTPRMLSPR